MDDGLQAVVRSVCGATKEQKEHKEMNALMEKYKIIKRVSWDKKIRTSNISLEMTQNKIDVILQCHNPRHNNSNHPCAKLCRLSLAF